MALLRVVQAIENRLRANFDRCPIIVENDVAELNPGEGPTLIVQFPWSTSDLYAIGGTCIEEGAARFVLIIPRGIGTHEGRQWLDEIADVFRNERFDDIRTIAPTSPRSDDRSDLPGGFRLIMMVPYETFIEGE